VSDVIEHVVAERDLDALTQILNRRAFELRATRLAADRKHRPLSMVICDIDHFKSVNDRFGHAAGDEVLREFSRILRAVVRADDIVGRIGGEEFVILLPGADRTLAKGIAERLRTVLMSTRFAQISSTLHVTVSAGVAQYQDDETVTTLLARADRLLYAAKRTGRNCTVADEAVVAPEASTRYLA
jgi:diguanylate cyclase (GGDEF)-like protein